MFDFLDPYLTYIKIAAIAIVVGGFLAIAGFGIYKYKQMEAQVTQLQGEVTTYKDAAEAEKVLNAQLKADVKQISAINTDITNSNKLYNLQFDKLQIKIQGLDNLPQLIVQNPVQATTEVNDLFNNTLKCLSDATGSDTKCAN